MISSCRHCLFFEGQGRRGGQCRQLGVPVRGSWKTCSLAAPPFVSSDWREIEIEAFVIWHQQSSESPLELQDAQDQPAELKLAPCQLDTLHLVGFQIDSLEAFQHNDSGVFISPPVSSPISQHIIPQNEVACSQLSAIKKLG